MDKIYIPKRITYIIDKNLALAHFASEKQDEKKQKKESAHEQLGRVLEKAYRAFLNYILKERAIRFEKRWIIQDKLQRVESDGLLKSKPHYFKLSKVSQRSTMKLLN